MSTGERIRMARLQARMTQKELADKIGVKFSAVHKYESVFESPTGTKEKRLISYLTKRF